MAQQTAAVQDDNAATNELWRVELAREMSEDVADGVAVQFPSILLDLLTKWPVDGVEAAREAARRIDADYRDVYLPSDPLLRGQEDKGMAGYLSHLYGLVMSVATFIDCDDPLQDALVQLLVELRKLPPTVYKIWGEDCLVYTSDPIFPDTTEDRWNANFGIAPSVLLSSGPPLDDSEKAAYERRCDSWVNFSSFLARCTAQGFYDDDSSLYKDASVDIPLGLGLEGESSPGKLGSCRLMVSLQWILHCGDKIRDNMIQSDKPKWNMGKWDQWVAKLKEIEEGGIEDAKVKAAAEKVLAGLVSTDAS
ncbi:hypothetical protein VMCG_01147 [Cytospora schulzeri]|uniref:Uncharacterized protein n=1 Tax=Cytospora schulzeri TaxID=448051 RepID=A0A423X682_9PEZI|nr:hypothetical protein VMCG_01147 [Valsa malicola]